MISAQDFQNCLQKLLSPNNQERGLAEKTLHSFSTTHPSEYVQASLDILSNQQATESQKVSSLVLMKKTIPIGKLKQRVFLQLPKEIRTNLQIFLLKNLNENQSEKQRNMICDLLAEIASSLYNDNQGLLPEGEKWENLFQFLKELFTTGQKHNLISVYKIIQSIIEQTEDYMQRHKDDLIKLLEYGFKQEDFEIKFICYLTLSKLVQFFKPQIVKQFKLFQYPFLQFVETTFLKNDEQILKKVLAEIFDICAYSPNFIKKYYKQVFIIMSKVRDMKLDDDQNIKMESVECLVNFVEQYPDLAKTQEQITPLVEIIFKNMLEIEDEISAEWCSPPDGFNDDLVEGDDQRVIKAAMHCLDTMFKFINEQTLLPIIFSYLEKMLAANNWKYTHAAIMSISQIAEYIEDDDEKLKKMVEILLSQKDHQNPRIRYSICHALGQLSTDQSPYFQDEYYESYFKIIVPYLNDPIPWVVAHAMASLTNFLESADEEQIKSYYEVLLQAFLYHLEKSIVFVKEGVLSALGAFAECFEESFAGQYESVINLIFNIFAYSTKKEFRQLISNAMETLTIICTVYQYEKFKPYEQRVIAELVKVQQIRKSEESTEQDTQMGYLISAWQRVIMLCEQNLVPYLDQILPGLLDNIKKPLEETKEDEAEAKTSMTDEMELALQLLSLFMKNYSKHIGKYLQEIYIILNLMNIKIKNKDIQISAFSLLPNLIKVSKEIQGFDYKTLSKQIFTNLWEKFIDEKDSTSKSEYCYFMQDVLIFGGEIFTQDEMKQFVLKVEQELQKSEQRRKDFLLNIDEEEEEDTQVVEQQKQLENEYEDQFKLEVANLFGKMFQSHKQNSISLFEYLYNHHVTPCLANPTDVNLEYAIFIIVDAVDFLGEFLPQQTLVQFQKILVGYINYGNYEIAQSAVYGVGLLSKKIQSESFKPLMPIVVNGITEFLKKDKQDYKGASSYQSCRDNFISSLGKLMNAHWQSINNEERKQVFNIWIDELPLTSDKKEGLEMNRILVDMVYSKQEIAIGADFSNLVKVIEIYRQVYETKKLSDDAINQQIKTQVHSLVNNQQVLAFLQQQNLTDNQKKFLEKLSKN